MKVIHIIPTLQNGGAENILARLVNEFSELGIHQIVITIQGSIHDFNYDRIVSSCEVIHYKGHPEEVRKVFKEHPEAKILAWMYGAIYFAHLWKMRFNTKNSIIWNIRHSNFGPSQWYQKIMLYFFGIASNVLKNKIIYCSHKSKEVHEKVFFNKQSSIVIVNRLAKKPLDNDFNKLFENKKSYFLFVGRFNPQKGPQHLINILDVFYKQYDNTEIWIAGNGWDINYFPSSIRSHVKLLGNRKDIFKLYQNAKLLLFTSTFGEGYPNVLVEAAAMGLPIIAFDAGDAKKILADYDHGYIVENEASFFEKLVWLMDNSPSESDRSSAADQQRKALDFSKTLVEYKEFLNL